MIIKTIETRTITVSSETYLEILAMIKNDGKYTCKIDGKPYYLAEMKALRMGETVEATFISLNEPHEIEVTADVNEHMG